MIYSSIVYIYLYVILKTVLNIPIIGLTDKSKDLRISEQIPGTVIAQRKYTTQDDMTRCDTRTGRSFISI